MTDSPRIIGRSRVQPRALPLGAAVPLNYRRPFDPTADPVEPITPKTADEFRAESEERRDQQPMATGCGFCDWRFEGTAGACREAAAAHREVEHPDATNRVGRGRGRGIGKWQRDTRNPDVIAADRAEANRVRAEREDAERLANIELGRQRDALASMDAGLPQDREEEKGAHAPHAESPAPQTADSPPPRDESRPQKTLADHDKGDTMHGNSRTSPASDRWNRQAIIEAIRAIAAETGFVPNQRHFNGPSTDKRPNLALIKRVFGSFGDAIEAAGYPRPQRGMAPRAVNTDSGREPQAEPAGDQERALSLPPASPLAAGTAEEASRPEEPLPADDEKQPASDLPAKDEVEESEAALAIPDPRDPIRTAAIPYDAEILDDEANFLIRRAAALRQMAPAIRVLAEPRDLAA